MIAKLRWLFVLALCFAPSLVVARPGGGQSFGGGSPSSGGGSYGGGSSFDGGSPFDGGGPYDGGSHFDDPSPWGSRTDRHVASDWQQHADRSFSNDAPAHSSGGGGDIGLTFMWLGLGALVLLGGAFSSGASWEWSSVSNANDPPLTPQPVVDLDALAQYDPNFSRALLDDFLHEVYVRGHQARGDAEAMAKLAPYLAPNARSALSSRGRATVVAVAQVVVGSSRILRMKLQPAQDAARIGVEYESNYTEVYAGEHTPSVRIYARETWTFARKLSARSRPPDQVHAFNCPACGAAVAVDQDRSCASCGADYQRADHEWRCLAIAVHDEQTTPPALGGYQPERGTDRATIFDPQLPARVAELRIVDPTFDAAALAARVGALYDRLGTAWSSLQWELVRPWCTDRFWLAQSYWIDAYRDQGLRNEMRDARVDRIELVKLARDAWFWSATVRIFATAIDVTVHQASGRIVGGSLAPRSYSEYWTLIRSVDRHGPASSSNACPSCGAPLSVGMTGNCDHCGVKVTGGAFDWVLSKIEQDDVYAG